MSKASGGTETSPDRRAEPNGSSSGDRAPSPAKRTSGEPELEPAGAGRQVFRTAVAVGYVPIAVTSQLISHSQATVYYAGVAALAAIGAIEWPVAGVVAAGVWVARRPVAGAPQV